MYSSTTLRMYGRQLSNLQQVRVAFWKVWLPRTLL